jgi:nucleoid-associated protein YgaU
LTHSRIVKSGDTLPLLSKEIYGNSAYYLQLAQANNLDDFRNLQPGQEIFFPPLAQ